MTGSAPKFTVHGWIWGADGKRDFWLKDLGERGHPAYCVPQEVLIPVYPQEAQLGATPTKTTIIRSAPPSLKEGRQSEGFTRLRRVSAVNAGVPAGSPPPQFIGNDRARDPLSSNGDPEPAGYRPVDDSDIPF